MKQWLFEKKDIRNSPSFKDDIDAETEDKYRREGVRFLMDIGAELKLSPHPTLATAAVYFHRFYMYHSFKEFSRHLTALGCLFLAGKTEETPKKCRDIVQLAKEKLSDKHWYQAFGKGDKDPKEEVMSVERVLLQTIKFDLQVQHPYTFLLKYAKLLKIDKEKARNMVQMAWTFVNDSLCTTLCLQWEPEIIAIALMYLASRLSKVEITDWHGKKGERGEKWWDQVVENMSMNLLEDICHQVLDLYSASTGKASGAGSASSSVAPTTSSPSGVPTSTPSSSTSSNKLSPYNPTNPATPSPARLPLGPGLTPVQTSGPPVLGSLTPMPPGALPPSRTPLHPQPPSSGGTLPVPSPQYPVPPGGYPTPQGGGFPYPPPRGYLPPPGQSRGTPVGPTPPPIHGSSYQQGFQHQNSYPRGY